jgi:molecular chaperone GrpE (heat shock protein)
MTLQETNPAAELETLDGTKPDSVESWANDAPLRLVAWALDSLGQKARSNQIKSKLEGDFVRDPDSEWKTWETWWKRVLPAVKHKDSEPYFGRGNGTEFILLSKVTDVPAVPWNDLTRKAKKAETKAPTVTDWKRWMLSDDASPPPGPRPTKPVCNALANLPVKDIALALHRIIGGAAELLESGSPSSHVAAGWVDAVSLGFVRFRELMPPDAVLSLAPQVGELLARLVKAAERSAGPTAQMISAGGLPLLPGTWLPGFAAGIWDGVQKSGGSARDLLEAPFPTVQDRSGLAREIVIAALDSAEPARQHRELDRILDCLPYREPVYFIRDLIVRSAARDVPRGAVLDYVADSRHAAGLPDSTERLDLLAMASLLLSNGSGEAVNKTAEQVSAALSGAADEQQTGPVWPALLSGARQHITDLRAQHAQDLEEQRLSHEAKLEELRREAEQLNRRVEHLQSQIAEGREKLRMDILQDMLSVIAETLQSLPEWAYNPETLVKNVEARLVLALGAGGAERLGTIGEIVPFDPRLHKSAKPIAIDSQVRVGVPGAMVRGKLTGDRVLIKAQVVQPSEVH